MKFFVRNSLVLFALISLSISCKFDKREPQVKIQDQKTITLSDEQLLDTIQKQTFNYFWEGAEPNSGLARERLHMDDVYPTSPKNTVTIGGSGFG